MKKKPIWDRLRRDAIEFGATVIILDTLSDIFAGNEIDRAQVSAFVKMCLGQLQRATGATIIVLAHPSQSGINSGTGTSGSTAWGNAVRSHVYLKYPDEDRKPAGQRPVKQNKRTDMRVLEGMKINGGKPGWEMKIRWVAGAFDLVQGAGRLVSEEEADPALTRASTVESASPQASIDDLVLSALAALDDVPMTEAPTSYKYAPKVLKKRDPDGTLADYQLSEIEAAFCRLQQAKRIIAAEISRDRSRHPVMGFRIRSHVSDKVSDDPKKKDVFQ